MTVEYDLDGVVTTVANVTEIIFVENGTKALLRTQAANTIIPLNKILSINAL